MLSGLRCCLLLQDGEAATGVLTAVLVLSDLDLAGTLAMMSAPAGFSFVPLGDFSFFPAVLSLPPLKLLPLTVRPCAEYLTALFSPKPLTRFIKSGQSLKLLFLRSSKILPYSEGPIPLMPSKSAALALFTSTAAKLANANNMANRHTHFFNMKNSWGCAPR